MGFCCFPLNDFNEPSSIANDAIKSEKEYHIPTFLEFNVLKRRKEIDVRRNERTPYLFISKKPNAEVSKDYISKCGD